MMKTPNHKCVLRIYPSCGARWINPRYVLRITVPPCQFARRHHTDAMPGVHCDMCAIRIAGSIFFFRDHKFTLICYTFSNTILWTIVQLRQDNIRLFLSMTQQQITTFLTQFIIIIIIIIIFIYCNWVVTRWQWLFYMYTKYEIGY